MFDNGSSRVVSPVVLARMASAAQNWRVRVPTAESKDLVEQIAVAARVENQAAAAQLVMIGELFAYRESQSVDTETWVIDTMEAVAAEVAAGLRIGQRSALGRVEQARTMRERLPKTAEVFIAGDIDVMAFSTIAYRTDLIEDPDILAKVDAVVAANVARWPSMSRGRLSGKVDEIVARLDLDAVRRRKERQRDREVGIGEDSDGICEIWGNLFAVDAHALDKRLTDLAATVCEHDPRTREQRRADALGALAAGADRLGCRCGRTDCTAGKRPASPVTIHVIAERAALNGADSPGGAGAWEIGADGLITPEIVEELATTANIVPLVHPGWSEPEPHYIPSKTLADFVRARDLTCRAPGCDVPASRCDIDHSIPYDAGGPTHAGNLNCKCRTHHLVKTFWGWTEKQLPDGTLIFTTPAGNTHVTTPGSALLFPSLCYAVGGIPAPEVEDPPPPPRECTNRTAAMPQRTRTRAQNHAARVTTERQANRQARQALRNCESPRAATDYDLSGSSDSSVSAVTDDDPPPF